MHVMLIAAIGVGLGLIAPEARAASLAQENDINQRLVEISVADEIRKRCDVITPRYFKVMSVMDDLKAEAINRGYSEQEIEAYLTDKTEKRRIRLLADTYIREHGAAPNDGPLLCVLGREEIARNSPIGELLTER